MRLPLTWNHHWRMSMQVIASWNGAQADALRLSMRMTVESFAEYLGLSPRLVAYWHKRPEMIPRPRTQSILDTVLDRAPDRVKAQFAVLVSEASSHAADTGPLPDSPDAMTGSLDASGPNPDEQARIRGVLHTPSRLDAATVAHLKEGLYGHRRAEDSIGPGLMIGPMKAELEILIQVFHETSGPHKSALMHLVTDWVTFIGWLHTELGEYGEADARFAMAEDMSDELGDGNLASIATSYRGYLGLLQGRYRTAIRDTAASLGTPGIHPTQVVYGTLQSAQAYAGIGDIREAKNLLSRASDLVTNAGEPPESAYWYTEPFLRMNIGLAQHAIGQHHDAADSLRTGIAGLPPDQRHAGWMDEYQQALDRAEAQTDAPQAGQAK